MAELYKARAEVREAIDNYAQAIVIMEDLIADFERTLFEVKSKRMNLTGDDEAIGTLQLDLDQFCETMLTFLYSYATDPRRRGS